MGFTIVLKPAWIFLASLFCLVHQSDQTSQNGLEESIKDLRNVILGKLADIEYKIASMDDSLRQVNTIINNDIKPKVESVEDKVNKIETEVTAIGLSSTSQSPMLMEIKQKVENIENEVSAYGQSPSLDKVLEGPINELKSQGNAIHASIIALSSNTLIMSTKMDTIGHEFKKGIASIQLPLEEFKSQGNATLQQMKMVKQESNMYSNAVDNLTSLISNEFKQGVASVIDPLKALKSQGNTTLQEIQFLKDEFILFNATELHQNGVEISNQINSIETTLNTSTEKIINKLFECTPISGIPKSSLTWHSVGSDNFVVFEEKKTWDNARKECMSHCLAMYKPEDVVTVAKFLQTNMVNTNYWLGARGNGTHQVWASGGALSRSEPWGGSDYNYVGTDKCLYAAAHSSWPGAGTPLGTMSCTGQLRVLCG